MSRIDWPGLMRVGIGQLGLAPEVFWRLTPAELQMLTGQGPTGQAAFTRARLDALVRAFPDRLKGDVDDRDRQFVRKAYGA
ncbi:MAG: phage tail assembly chaperone [Rhodobacter sp.]|nr:phage tail assembly chaperone [Rhodobacter sp.]